MVHKALVQGLRLGSKFEPGILIFSRGVFLNPPIGYANEVVPSKMYVPTITVSGANGELAGVDLLVGGFYNDNSTGLKPIGTVQRYDDAKTGSTTFTITPYTALRFGLVTSGQGRVVSGVAFALSTNQTLPYFPRVGVVSSNTATINETIYLTSLDFNRHARIGIAQEITQDLQGRTWTAYTSQTQALSLLYFTNFQYAGLLLPLNDPSNGDDEWITQKTTMKPTYTWLDLLSSMSGTLPLVTGVYYVLFGVGRVQPWGIFQAYILRQQVLSQVDEPVLTIPAYKKIGSKIYTDDQRPHDEKNQVAIQMPMPFDSDVQTIEARIAQLEAFQQRMEIFYLNHQLFESKKL
ncbi:hypothetical protein K493DRAFT_406489 [Basidiobolus meristosporus CBS 931.73]|uniref:Uncharacterized protein n=1 Tax=Basidiobolus meristosporus CBS 931.73 TaxID=1314790 RepID=A0A1Y1YL30_9FUNG|nr:hypothetical protein K493DRAFT_406489 [Basidiobolus meristosporus CBS 931.73]|eukprot:ORX98695.1 hypothetical protein K493DRAFT_406489 [Basidiobolus meristosporus CBS 931.73]